MALAEKSAWKHIPDYLLWLNDDVLLDNDAIKRLVACSDRHPNAIVVGAMRDPSSGEQTYGAHLRTGTHPMKISLVPVSSIDQFAHTFHGNCVLIPRHVRTAVGPIDGNFEHAMADTDYGYRATRQGFAIVQVPGTVGSCASNAREHPSGDFRTIHRELRSHKGLPYRSHKRFLRKHAGGNWPLLLVLGRLNILRHAIRITRQGRLK